jgi:hypothetical protein
MTYIEAALYLPKTEHGQPPGLFIPIIAAPHVKDKLMR